MNPEHFIFNLDMYFMLQFFSTSFNSKTILVLPVRQKLEYVILKRNVQKGEEWREMPVRLVLALAVSVSDHHKTILVGLAKSPMLSSLSNSC